MRAGRFPFRVLPVVACLPLWGCGVASPPPEGEEATRGSRLYGEWNCGACHGEARQGTEFGPSLTALAGTWTERELAAFLADPEAAASGKPHLRELKERFPAAMPAFAGAEDDRRALAAWLLAGGAAR